MKELNVLKTIIKLGAIALGLFAYLFLPAESISDASFFYIEGTASWYAEFSPGIRETTANMEIFNHDNLTCAIWDVPFGTILEVTNIDNGKKVIVRVNDRGPAKRLCADGRVIDLTMAAFGRIEDLDRGLTRVKIRVITPVEN